MRRTKDRVEQWVATALLVVMVTAGALLALWL